MFAELPQNAAAGPARRRIDQDVADQVDVHEMWRETAQLPDVRGKLTHIHLRQHAGTCWAAFQGCVLLSGVHLVPEATLEALADQGVSYTVKRKATYEQQVAALRGAARSPIQ